MDARGLVAAALLVGALSGAATGLVIIDPLDIAGTFFHVTATFGPRLPLAGVEGEVVEAIPPNACTPLTNEGLEDQIIVTDRGDCDFIQKVRNAQAAGATAVVVANNEGEHLFKMFSSDGDTSDVLIPSVFVTTATGAKIRGATVVLNATGEYDFGDDDIMHPYFFMAIILLGLSVTLACTLSATLVGYVVVSFKTRRQRTEIARTVGKLKTTTYEVSAEGAEADACTICLDDFVAGDKVKELPCGHSYHKSCIDPWLLQKSSLCPLCKQSIQGGGVDLHAPPPAAPVASLEASLMDGQQPAHTTESNMLAHSPTAAAAPPLLTSDGYPVGAAEQLALHAAAHNNAASPPIAPQTPRRQSVSNVQGSE